MYTLTVYLDLILTILKFAHCTCRFHLRTYPCRDPVNHPATKRIAFWNAFTYQLTHHLYICEAWKNVIGITSLNFPCDNLEIIIYRWFGEFWIQPEFSYGTHEVHALVLSCHKKARRHRTRVFSLEYSHIESTTEFLQSTADSWMNSTRLFLQILTESYSTD